MDLSPETKQSAPVKRKQFDASTLSKRIEGLVLRARLSEFLEAVWPRILPLLAVLGLYLTLSWFGIWLAMPWWMRIVSLGLLALIGLAALWPLRDLRWPSRDQALRRIERTSGTKHRPLSFFDDQPAQISSSSDVSDRLWTTHLERQFRALKTLRVGWPNPDASKVDPFQLRAALVLILVVAFAYAGEDRTRRMAALTDPAIETVPALARLDAWVTPPEYTRRAPIFLTRLDVDAQPETIDLPAGSVFTLQSDADGALTVSVHSGEATHQIPALSPDTAASTNDGQTSPSNRFEATLDNDSVIKVEGDFGASRSWQFTVIPDLPPEITIDGLPEVAASGALEIRYLLKDDYGIVSGDVKFTPNVAQSPDARPLYEAPEMVLSLPRSRVREGSGRTLENLTEHPWAGIEVTMQLRVTDDADQVGKSGTLDMELPIRPFREPLARALVEQRQTLALDANRVQHVADALDLLLFAPDEFIADYTHFLSISIARKRLLLAEDDDALRDVAELLWEIALGIEDGDLSDVERRLREAQEALQDALENDASDEEIARLTQELREAMNDYLQALAREMQNNPDMQQAMPMDPNQQTVTPQDLDQMLDQIEDLARSGSRDAAREMLSQMQRMLENLQNGQPQMSQQMQEMQDMMRQMGELIDRQQQLMDETFRRDQQMQQQWQQQQGQQQGSQQQQSQQQGQQGQQQQGQQGPLSQSELEQALRELQQGQSDVHDGLQALMDQLAENGFQPGEQMGEADGAMGQAEEQLGQGQPGDAVGSQSRALQALRDGAQSMMQQFAQQGQQGQQPGQQQGQGLQGGSGPQQGRPGGMTQGSDPLGRPQRSRGADDGDEVKVPGEIEIQRAREILDAIRRRMEDMGRPQIEMDYLERLLPQ